MDSSYEPQGSWGIQLEDLQNLGSNVIVVLPARSDAGGVRQFSVATLTAGDATAMADECPAVLAVCPLVPTTGQVIGGRAVVAELARGGRT